jgi:predicted RecB family nuclease
VINDLLIDAFISCSHKSFLLKNSIAEDVLDDFSLLESQLKEEYKKRFIEVQLKNHPFTYFNNTNLFKIQSQKREEYLVDIYYSDSDYHLLFPIARKTIKELTPIYISINENVSKEDKIKAIIKALIFNSRNHKIKIKEVHFIKSETTKIGKVKVTSCPQFQKTIAELTELNSSGKSTTKPFWIPHCQVCRFQKVCRKELEEKGDISLISGLRPKEITSKNSKGIYSITQLSYLFTPQKKLYSKKKFIPELKALAIREHKTYVIKAPAFNNILTEIFFDIEGIPDSKYFYLIGVIIREKNHLKTWTFWSEDNSTNNIFIDFLDAVEPYKEAQFYHFGSFETTTLKYIGKKIKQEKYQKMVAFIAQNSVNLLKEFTENIYPPTFRNSLKEIANFLGFYWHTNITGYKTILLRKQWDLEHNVSIKDALIHYNKEDCEALIVIKDWLSKVAQNEQIHLVSSLNSKGLFKFGDTGYTLPELNEINQYAYFNYQRDKIYLKTNKFLKSKPLNKKNSTSKKLKVNKIIPLVKPDTCPFCDHKKLYKNKNKSRATIDLKFTNNGIKRWIVLNDVGRFRCASCLKVFTINKLDTKPKYGKNLMIWSVNQNVTYNISFRNISKIINEQFCINLSGATIVRFRTIIAQEYHNVYESIKNYVISGNLIQIDESEVNVKGFGSKCYIWVFATINSVFYMFKQNREAEFLKDLLKDFKGVIISDFYTGYDSLDFPQQKCLVHFMRDLNDDLLKNPFNEEFTFIINGFTMLLRNITQTINRYGLKKRYLHKHVKEADNFINSVINKKFESEIAQFYSKKIKKYRNKLFTFLDYNNIPWNNNNAEAAIKPFANHRNHFGGIHTNNGIEEYLTLLSIQQTCKYRNKSFLEFLKSNSKQL